MLKVNPPAKQPGEQPAEPFWTPEREKILSQFVDGVMSRGLERLGTQQPDDKQKLARNLVRRGKQVDAGELVDRGIMAPAVGDKGARKDTDGKLQESLKGLEDRQTKVEEVLAALVTLQTNAHERQVQIETWLKQLIVAKAPDGTGVDACSSS